MKGAEMMEGGRLGPQLRSTPAALLEGDSEKQVARRLGISQHTVHVYVKMLYRRFEVNSRSELLARFIRQGDEESGRPGRYESALHPPAIR